MGAQVHVSVLDIHDFYQMFCDLLEGKRHEIREHVDYGGLSVLQIQDH